MDNQNLPVEQNQENSLSTVRLEDYQAFYHWLNAKPDSEVQIYPNNRRFKFEDFKELNGKILDKLELHDVVSASTTVSISLSNKKTLEFGSWEKFINHDFTISPETKAINIIWDFYIKLKNYQLPQRHTVKLRLGSHLKPAEFIQLMWQGDDEQSLEEAASHVVCKIDFINPVISNELFGIISDWHESLTKNIFQNNFHKFLKRHHKKFETVIIVLFLIAGTFIIVPTIDFINTKFSFLSFNNLKINSILFILSGFSIGIYLSYIFGKFWADRTANLIERITPMYYFEVTKGDKNKVEESKMDNNKTLKKLLKELGVAIGVDVIAFIFWQIIKMI